MPTIFEHRTIETDVTAVVRKADGTLKQVIHQVDDLDGHLKVLEDRRVIHKTGGFLGNVRDVTLFGLPHFGYRTSVREKRPYALDRKVSSGILPNISNRDLLLGMLNVGLLTKDGLGDAANLLVSDLAAATRFDSIAVGIDGQAGGSGVLLPLSSSNVCLGNEVPFNDASLMTRRSGASVVGTLDSTLAGVTQGGRNGNYSASQWVTTFTSSGTIGIWEVGVFNATGVPNQTATTATLTNAATSVSVTNSSTAAFGAAGGPAAVLLEAEACKYSAKTTGTPDTFTISRGDFASTAVAHNTIGTKVSEILGDMLLRQIFANVLNLVSTDTLQLTVKVNHT